ncbi:Phosphoenolpyruvate-dihydroxyacetone phosphotransferase, ADP-binding subunit DhaL [Olavius algarvensis spirochete endosymbiont]|uniref:dihydroxyacetone kinase subunit DhaL n=1 Tax=Olavius algarvensis spirochete endosymbiont TaxID=260710 RepID=UPI00052CF086|nr:dihydroxyacetone kinase subunit DhaL [Olavius algarvensis spirochete endosymbiont]KGM42582.1 hypothetical protein JY97_12880 [Alkalispirochaeta odontotermitis]VDA99423.1 Phosphoenolpyruvate-dihydroxyacetone phosphotransferase, ADP-binding subunit DhaL [Olavius algarvensis spirochete endosymbiont]
MDASTAKKAIDCIRKLMEENRDFLIELDSIIGDGDLGLTMTMAFNTADDKMKNLEESDIGQLFFKTGMEIAKAAPSTMGTLVATGFMRGGMALKGKIELFPADMALFFRAFADALIDRGKSKPGEKSIIDVIDPAATAMEGSTDDWNTLADAGIAAARSGLENTKMMMARHGRAAYYQEKSIGKQDPGGTAGLFIVEGMLKAFKSEK